jgi:hypothetical protein
MEGIGVVTSDEVSPADAIRQWSTAYQVSRVLHIVAKLGIADLLKDGPRSVEALAASTATHAPTLYRLLRLLASHGIFAEQDNGQFDLTQRAQMLRSDVPDSQLGWVLLNGGPSYWACWGALEETARSGESQFQRLHGVSRWQYLEHNPDESAIFDSAMSVLTGVESAAVTSAYDFSQFGTLVDVGGGVGGQLAAILAAHPSVKGTLFDQPHVVSESAGTLERAGVTDRCQVVGGSFFESVPGGADAYLLKSVIHDWDDERSIAILRTCRAAMTNTSRLLLVERIIQPGNGPDPAKAIDVLMLVIPGGRERTVDEFERLFAEAGLRLTNVVRTRSLMNIVEAVSV